jgi:hypothetical protein
MQGELGPKGWLVIVSKMLGRSELAEIERRYFETKAQCDAYVAQQTSEGNHVNVIPRG